MRFLRWQPKLGECLLLSELVLGSAPHEVLQLSSGLHSYVWLQSSARTAAEVTKRRGDLKYHSCEKIKVSRDICLSNPEYECIC